MEQRRFLLAMILSGLVIFLWQVFLVEPTEPTDEETEIAVEEEADAEEADPEEADPDPDAADPDQESDEIAEDDVDPQELEDASEQVSDDERPEIALRDDLKMKPKGIDVVLSNRGAVVQDVQVTSPDQFAGQGGQIMRAFEPDAPGRPYSTVFMDGMIDISPDELYEVVEEESELAADGETYERLVFRYDDPRDRYVVDKIYSVDESRPYVVHLNIEVQNGLEDVPLNDTMAVDIYGRDDPDEESSFLDFRPDVLEAVCHTADGIERTVFENLEEREQYSQYNVMWAGADTRYFMMASVPIDGAESCTFNSAGEDYLRTRIFHERFAIQPEESWSTRHMLFMGPKDFDVLRDTGHELEESVDYGLLTILARPLRYLLVKFHGFTGNWGLAIILLTLLIKGLTWRITGKAYNNAERMKQIQPVIKEIREKYENDQQRMTEETMKAFKEHNVSPLGCLPLLLQMPILYGLFVMIYNSVELYHADFLWYADLSAPDPWFMLPLLMGAVMFVQQRLTMSTAATTNPQMQMVMKVMPVAFTGFMLFLPAGLVLYYLLNLVMGLGQQFLIKRRFRLAEEAGEEV